MNSTIFLTETRLQKNPNTKTTYIQEDQTSKEITAQEYRNITEDDTLKFFRRLGGTESAQRSYTCAGYLITKLTSTSPDRQNKTVREFKFI
jgi:hypothetical protein